MSNFQITLKLTRQPSGLYTLSAATLSPDSCHIATKAMRGAIIGQDVPKDHIAVLLPTVTREPCTGAATTILHHLSGLQLGSGTGKMGVTAFLIVNPGRGLIDVASIRLVRTRNGRLVPDQAVR